MKKSTNASLSNNIVAKILLKLEDIMLMIGRESLRDIQKYRQVHQNLSVKITQMTGDQAQERHRQGSEEKGGVKGHEVEFSSRVCRAGWLDKGSHKGLYLDHCEIRCLMAAYD